MINFNGIIIPNLSEGNEYVLQNLLTGFSIKEELRSHKSALLFWELHYFRIIAALRRHRFNIPMEYTLAYLEKELLKTVKNGYSSYFLLEITFVKDKEAVHFIILSTEVPQFSINPLSSYSIDLYKEEKISSGFFSNLTRTNTSLRIIAKSYASENGLDDCLLLNDQKNLTEPIEGTLYLFQGTSIFTPHLESGCQDFTFREAFNLWISKEQTAYTLLEKEINPFELQKSDELMLLSIQKGVQNITNYRKTIYNQGKSGLLFGKFIATLD
jgi:branched-chain amino acid aminotransferase|tara:strand:+ start:2004 stop:2813 length:810 start_codon:yes stop_codon:yes gene_type:complete